MSSFVDAAACGDLEDIKTQLKDNKTSKDVINATDKDGRSALHYSCLNDDTNLLPLLLADDRVDVAKLTPNKECVFHLSALYSSMEAIKLLGACTRVMEHEAKLINAPNKFGETPLHLCAGTGNKKSGETAKLLLKLGASLTVVDQWSRGPIDVAGINGYAWLKDELLAHSKTLSEQIQMEIKKISEKAAEERLIKVKPSAKGVQAKVALKGLFSGGKLPQLKKTTTVEKHMFKTTEGGVVPGNKKMQAKKAGPILSKLIEFPGDRAEINKLVKDPKVDVAGKDMFGVTALQKFASWNKPEMMELIIGRLTPEQVNATDLEGKTALHFACEMAAVSSVTYLVQHGADMTVKDKKGRTPMDIVELAEPNLQKRLKRAIKG